jgi:hypothetical protein
MDLIVNLKKIDPENISFFKTYETITKNFGNI